MRSINHVPSSTLMDLNDASQSLAGFFVLITSGFRYNHHNAQYHHKPISTLTPGKPLKTPTFFHFLAQFPQLQFGQDSPINAQLTSWLYLPLAWSLPKRELTQVNHTDNPHNQPLLDIVDHHSPWLYLPFHHQFIGQPSGS